MRSKRTKPQLETGNDACMLTAVTKSCVAQPRLPDCVLIYIDSFLVEWILERASGRGFVDLLDKLVMKEWRGMSRQFRVKRLEYAIKCAIDQDKLEVLKWWVTTYKPDDYNPRTQIFLTALLCGRLNVFHWIRNQKKWFLGHGDEIAKVEMLCRSLPCALWVHEHKPQGIQMVIDVGYHCSEEDDIEFVKWAHAHRKVYKIVGMKRLFCGSAYFGRLANLQWLEATQCDWSQYAFQLALSKGHLEIAKWLDAAYPGGFNESGICSLSYEMVTWLALEFKWQSENSRLNWINNQVSRHAEINDVQTVEFLCSACSVVAQSEAMHKVARQGHLQMVKRLHELDAEANASVMDAAASAGHLNIVQWLHENRTEGCTTDAMDEAAKNSHLDVLNWLHCHRTEGCSFMAMDSAVANNRMDIVEWLHNNRSEANVKWAMERAAEKGYLNMIEWLHIHFPKNWTPEVMDTAAANDHLDIVKFLHVNRNEGCTTKAMDKAASNGHLDVVQWLHENRCEGCTRSAIYGAVHGGHLRVLQYLVEYICPERCDQLTPSYRIENGLCILQWFRIMDFFGSYQSYCMGSHSKHWAIMKYLIAEREASYDKDLLEILAGKSHFALLEWLVKHAHSERGINILSPYAQMLST